MRLGVAGKLPKAKQAGFFLGSPACLLYETSKQLDLKEQAALPRFSCTFLTLA
jgi:hypothetical protein